MRYDRQALIKDYQERFGCRLIVLIDTIFPELVTPFEELLVDSNPEQDLHLLLDTPGGDGETAVRLARSAQSRCKELTVIVPNQAKSAGTLLALGAHHIFMGPTSDLGPVDPQFQNPEGPGLYAAKDLIGALERAEQALAANPDSYPLYVSLFGGFTAVMVQQAESAIARTGDLLKEALESNPDRLSDEVDRLRAALKERLVDLPHDHGATFSAADAHGVDLPVIDADPLSDQWRLVWRLWAKYYALDAWVCEGDYASQVTKRSSYSA